MLYTLPMKNDNEKYFPEVLNLAFNKVEEIAQHHNNDGAALYKNPDSSDYGVFGCSQLEGSKLTSYDVIAVDTAITCLEEFNEPACVVVNKSIPFSAAEKPDIFDAFLGAWKANERSLLGSTVALNRPCTAEIAAHIVEQFIYVVAATAYSSEALEILRKRPKLKIIKLPELTRELDKNKLDKYSFRAIRGGLLVYKTHTEKEISAENLKIVTVSQPSKEDLDNMIFAWKISRNMPLNAVVIVRDKITLGVGQGGASRIDVLETVLRNAGGFLHNAVIATNSFLYSRSCIDILGRARIGGIIQPGGSIRDAEVIDSANEHEISMVIV